MYLFYALQVSVKLGSKFGQKLLFLYCELCTNRIAVFNNFFPVICSQQGDKQNRACDFLLSRYFLNNLLLTVFMQNMLSKLIELLQ